MILEIKIKLYSRYNGARNKSPVHTLLGLDTKL